MKRIAFAFLTVLVSLAALRAEMVEEFYLRPDLAKARVDSLVAATPADSLPGLLDRASDLFFEPASPQYCEGLMALYLQAALPRLTDETEREIALWKLNDVCLLNAEGTPAADFDFELDVAPGRTSLSDFHTPGESLCLIFYDPDCGHCSEIIAALASIESQIRVLAVCVDSSHERWAETRSNLPPAWSRAYDLSDIIENETYMLRALPGVYLLDANRNVALKNPTPSRLINFLDR